MMNLGTETGSLVNHLLSAQVAPEEVKVGTPATTLSWTDRSPGTVVKTFKKGKFSYIEVQADNYTRTDANGMSECQAYTYTRNPDGYISTYRVTDSGFELVYLSESGRYKKSGSKGGLLLGKRERYYDPSF